MHDNTDDPEEARRAEVRRWADEVIEINKETFAKEAFGDAFVNILREVNRSQHGSSGASELGRFFEMLARGARVSFGELSQAALRRIDPSTVQQGADRELTPRNEALIAVAKAGLAFLIEHAATDGYAKSRRSRRENDLIQAMKDFEEVMSEERALLVPQSRGPHQMPATRRNQGAKARLPSKPPKFT